ncbi:MAG: multicopper oxidase domain-containing protein [Acidobacteriota bacterium]|nr:multicopper oxidase domain-containing protein [Acidobacteriota bacterium]
MKRVIAAATAILFAAPLLFAQQGKKKQNTPPANAIDCGPNILKAPLPSIPEIQSSNGVLRGALYTVSEQQKFTVSNPNDASSPYCYPQWVRAYRVSPPSSWNPPASQLLNPVPGPTLRARVGDMIELTFLNLIDPLKFGKVDTGRCDQTTAYPGSTGDVYPDCFAGSVITNVHYHGTHTNPNATGDNVFLQVQPVPRDKDTNVPAFSFQDVYPSFQEFFGRCEQQLMSNPGPKEWPRQWDDMPEGVRTTLSDALKKHAPQWWEIDQREIAQGNFPQYFVGAFPYCFKLPDYAAAAATTASTAVRTPHTHGAGSGEIEEAEAPLRPLVMGQSPGTHWYHAHKHGSTTINVLNGMTGVFIIEGPYDDALNETYGAGWTRSQPTLVVNQLGSLPALMAGTFLGPGPLFSVNGALQPTLTMAGNSVQMWRFANTSSRAGMQFEKPPNGFQWKQLAQDGVQFNDANYKAPENNDPAILLFPGNRADLLVKAPPYDPNGDNLYEIAVYNTVDASDRRPARPSAASTTLLWVKVTENAATPQTLMADAPPFPPFLNDITDEEITGTKTLTFASSAPAPDPRSPASRHTIDGKLFDGEIGAAVVLNRAEEWKIVNATYPPATGNQISHPFHIHINPFQVSEVFDPNAVLSHKEGKGTVSLGADGYVTGKGTTFTKDFRVGDWIWFDAGKPLPLPAAPAPGIVLKIESDTRMQVNVNRVSTDVKYEIAIPLYTIDKKYRRPKQCLLDPKKPSTWKPCSATEPEKNRIWWDVFPIPSGNTFHAADGTTKDIPGYFKMRSRFVDYSGYYVLHCHILAHEDRGMMTVVEVVPLQTPFSHH